MNARRWFAIGCVSWTLWSVAVAAEQGGVPVIEVPAAPASATVKPGPLVIFLSGDGGWAEIDREIAKRLAANGWPVVGVDLPKYLSTPRTPPETAHAVQGVIEKYLAKWHRDRVVMCGFSRGADLAPFVVNRLTPEMNEKVVLIALFSPGTEAEFEFHFMNWLGVQHGPRFPVEPELVRLADRPLLIFSGTKDEDRIVLKGKVGQTILLQGDHHLGRNYNDLAGMVREALGARPRETAGMH